jgi:hypothetical protein
VCEWCREGRGGNKEEKGEENKLVNNKGKGRGDTT